MHYKIIITERAEELLDNLVNYLLLNIKSRQAAVHLLDNVEKLYGCLEENPFQFPVSKDIYLSNKGYREAVLFDMKYLAVYKVEEDTVYILGIFHELEQYQNKLQSI